MSMSECVFRDIIQTGLVAFRDLGTADQPRVVSGEEDILFLPGHLVVVGRSDRDIQVEVRVGGGDLSGAQRVFGGVMNFRSGVLSVSEPESPDEESLRLPRCGSWNVQVYLRSAPEREELYFILDAAQWIGM